jgi:glucose/arabinose dehydrogenase
MVAKVVRPDYGLQSHTAPLGVAFSGPAIGGRFANGAFIGMHGSWNREQPAGYKVVFAPFSGGRPSGPPLDFVAGFQADGKTFGRPVGVTVDPRGALLVADDLSNTLRRVTPTQRAAAPAQVASAR